MGHILKSTVQCTLKQREAAKIKQQKQAAKTPEAVAIAEK